MAGPPPGGRALWAALSVAALLRGAVAERHWDALDEEHDALSTAAASSSKAKLLTDWFPCDQAHEQRSKLSEQVNLDDMGASGLHQLMREHLGGSAQHGERLSAVHKPWECSYVAVPSSYAPSSDGRTLKVFLRRAMIERLEDDLDAKHPTLWLLQGGPGSSGSGLEYLMGRAPYLEGFDVYIPDHRGVPMSETMRCHRTTLAWLKAAGPSSAVPESCTDLEPCHEPLAMLKVATARDNCIKEVREQGLEPKDFTCTNAARDVLEMQNLFAHSIGVEASVFGVSYGTMWTQRIMQVAHHEGPTRGYSPLKRAVLIGAIAFGPGGYTLDPREMNMVKEDIGRAVLADCVQSEACAVHYGQDVDTAVSTLESYRDKLRAAKGQDGADACSKKFLSVSEAFPPAFGDPFNAVLFLGFRFGFVNGADFRQIVLAALARIFRCDEAYGDLQAVSVFLDTVGAVAKQFEAGLGGPHSESLILKANIQGGEMTRRESEGDPPDEFKDRKPTSGSVFRWGEDETVSRFALTEPPDEYYSMGVETGGTPVLVVNGKFDPQTPVPSAQMVLDKIEAPCKTMLVEPRGGHDDLYTYACTMGVVKVFLEASGSDAEVCTAAENAPATLGCGDAPMSRPIDWGTPESPNVHGVLPGLWGAVKL